jgi:hypothetical protein
LCGSVANTVGPLHRHPTAYGKGGKHPANTPVAPLESLGDLFVPNLKIDRRRAAQALEPALTLGLTYFSFSWKRNPNRIVPLAAAGFSPIQPGPF